MAIVAIAGMPGSGKSGLITLYVQNGYKDLDDFLMCRDRNLEQAKTWNKEGKNIVLWDIEFCGEDKRHDLERDLGIQIQWVFFENNPYQCAKNVLYRRFVKLAHQKDWGEEMKKIDRLCKTYLPSGDVRPVVVTPSLP